MRQYKIIARALLTLPIINFAFALPIAVQETPQVSGDVVLPDVAITMSAKRANEMEKLRGMYFERLGGKKESDLAGLKGLLGGPELTKSPSLDHYLAPQELTKSPSFDHYLAPQPEQSISPPLDHHVVSTDPGATSSSMEKAESKTFLSKVVSKVKLWRRIPGPGSVRDVVNATQREFQRLVDTGTYVSASSPEVRVTNVLTL